LKKPFRGFKESVSWPTSATVKEIHPEYEDLEVSCSESREIWFLLEGEEKIF
jgi:hypothetical protein